MGPCGTNVGFGGKGKTEIPGEKPLGARKRSNKLSPHETPDRRIEPGPHWWEASALATTPSVARDCIYQSFAPVLSLPRIQNNASFVPLDAGKQPFQLTFSESGFQLEHRK